MTDPCLDAILFGALGLGLAAVVAGLLYAVTRDYRAAIGTILSVAAMIILLVW